MMRADALNSHVYPLRTKITTTQHIPTSHVFSSANSELKEFLIGETLYRICSTDKDESKGIIVDEFSADDDKSECIDKNINKKRRK